VDDDVASNALLVVERLRSAGAVVEEVSMPWKLATLNRAARIHFGMIFGPSMAETYEGHRDELTPYARKLFEESAEIEKADFVAGLALEAQLYRPLGELLDRYDALVCPTFAIPAFTAEWDTSDPLAVNGQTLDDWFDVMMTIPFNIASRCPVMSVPSGRSREGVPTGMSIVGPTYDDVTVFRIGAALERVEPWLDSPSNRPAL
jgi:Asp-tRNA(Asn)/Glu-tRNA(Gln) amidotransferase A subunit family amidase